MDDDGAQLFFHEPMECLSIYLFLTFAYSRGAKKARYKRLQGNFFRHEYLCKFLRRKHQTWGFLILFKTLKLTQDFREFAHVHKMILKILRCRKILILFHKLSLHSRSYSFLIL